MLHKRENVDYESSRNGCLIEVLVGVFDKVDEGILAVLNLIAIGRSHNDTTGQSTKDINGFGIEITDMHSLAKMLKQIFGFGHNSLKEASSLVFD